MKQCPVCREHFEDSQNFCDADGTLLQDQTELLRAALKNQGVVASPAQKIWPIVTIGILIGVIICLGVYVVMITKSTETAENQKNPESAKLNTSATQNAIRPQPLPVPTVEQPIAEESPTASPVETPVEVAETKAEAPSPSLNDGPISTNRQEGEKRGHTVIKLKSGVRVEADAAWEDRMGVWYRQGGLVSYVERERIESIGEPPKPKSSPTEADKP
jgi:hypothetical protein